MYAQGPKDYQNKTGSAIRKGQVTQRQGQKLKQNINY